jgi:hypothetical protein
MTINFLVFTYNSFNRLSYFCCHSFSSFAFSFFDLSNAFSNLTISLSNFLLSSLFSEKLKKTIVISVTLLFITSFPTFHVVRERAQVLDNFREMFTVCQHDVKLLFQRFFNFFFVKPLECKFLMTNIFDSLKRIVLTL